MDWPENHPVLRPWVLLLLCLCGCGTPIPPKRSTDTPVLTASALARAMPQRLIASETARIISIIAIEPSTDTPPYCHWILHQHPFQGPIWVFTRGRTAQFCKEVTITATAQPGFYALEQSHFWNGPWRKVSASSTQLFYAPTNGAVAWRMGSPYAENYFRVVRQ